MLIAVPDMIVASKPPQMRQDCDTPASADESTHQAVTHRILAWYIGICAVLVFIVQLLSPFHALAPDALLIGIGIAGGTAFLIHRTRIRRALQPSRPPRPFNPISLTGPLLAALFIIACISLALGLHTPPNNWDSMAYHLSRAAYWREWHTLAHFPTYKWNQNANPGNAEVLLLVTLLLAHADTFAFLVQFSAYLAATLAVYGLGRQIGLKPVFAFVGAGMFATMPEVVLQSVTTQNDLTAAAFTTCAVYFLFDAITKHRTASVLLAAAALGLALGTKPTALFALPGLGLGAAIVLRRYAIPRLSVKIVTTACAAVLLVVALGAPWYIADETAYGSLTGPPIVNQLEKTPTLSLQIMRVNVARYVIGLIDPAGPLFLTRAAPALCSRTTTLHSALGSALHVPATAPGAQVAGTAYSPAPTCSFNEDVSWFGAAGIIAVLAAIAAVLAPLKTRRIELPWLLGSGVLSYLLLFSLLLRWSPFQQRLLITMMALAAPLLGLAAQRLWQWRLGRPLVQIAVLYVALTGLSAAVDNSIKPLGAWNADRISVQVITRPDMGPILRRVATSVPTTARVGTLLQDGDWDYPLFGPRLERTIEPLIPTARTTAYAIPPARLDYVISHQPAAEAGHLFQEWRLKNCRRLWVLKVTDSTVPWTLYQCGSSPGALSRALPAAVASVRRRDSLAAAARNAIRRLS